MVLFYLECVSIFAETAFLGHEISLATTTITVRFIAAVVCLSIYSLLTIISVTLCTVLMHIIRIGLMLRQDLQWSVSVTLESILSTIIVFTVAVAFWTTLHYIAQLKADLDS